MVQIELFGFGNHDENPHRDKPYLTYTLMALYIIVGSILVFGDPETIKKFGALQGTSGFFAIGRLSFFTNPILNDVASLFTFPALFLSYFCTFVVWVLADNLEYVMGRLRFIAFYMVSGLSGLWLVSLIPFDPLEYAFIPPNDVLFHTSASNASVAAITAIYGAYLRIFPNIKFNYYGKSNLLRIRWFQSGPFIYIGYLFLINLILVVLSTMMHNMKFEFTLMLYGLVFGYGLSPYFRDRLVTIDEPKIPLPNNGKGKDFSYYNQSKDPTDSKTE